MPQRERKVFDEIVYFLNTISFLVKKFQDFHL